jgi:hypothetical protein
LIEQLAQMADVIPQALKPKTFEELKHMTAGKKPCQRCGQKDSTHTISMTAAKVGQGRGGVVAQIQRVPVCEGCGVELFAVIKKALKA